MNSHNEQEELDDLLSTVNQNEEEKEVPLQDLKGGVDKLSLLRIFVHYISSYWEI